MTIANKDRILQNLRGKDAAAADFYAFYGKLSAIADLADGANLASRIREEIVTRGLETGVDDLELDYTATNILSDTEAEEIRTEARNLRKQYTAAYLKHLLNKASPDQLEAIVTAGRGNHANIRGALSNLGVAPRSGPGNPFAVANANINFAAMNAQLNQNILEDNEADLIFDLAKARKQQLHVDAINTAINNVTNPQLLEAIVNVNTGTDAEKAEAIRGLLHNNGDLGGIDFTTGNHHQDDFIISDAQALAIQAAVLAKKQSLHFKTIEDIINAITDPAKLAALVALATGAAPATPEQIRDVLHADQALFTIDFGAHTADAFILSDGDAQKIPAMALAQLTKIKQNNVSAIEKGIDAADAAQLNDLAAAATPADIRTELAKNKAMFGGAATTSPPDFEKLLTDQQAIELRDRAVQQRNALLITEGIEKFVVNDLKALREVATAGTPAAIRAAITAHHTLLGGVSLAAHSPTTPQLSDAQADAIKKLATQRFNELNMQQSIAKVKNPSLLDAIIKAATPDDIRTALNNIAAPGLHAGLINQGGGADALSDDAANRLKALAQQQQKLLIANQNTLATHLMGKSSVLDVFTDEVVRAGSSAAKAAQMAGMSTTGPSVATARPGDVVYEGTRLNEGDVIQSSIKFSKTIRGASGQPPTPVEVTATLVQDHTGKVTNVTPELASLSEEEQSLLAIKQAQMILNNYKAGQGDIIVRGRDVKQANRVYAALIHLQEAHPSLAKVEVKCFAPGFEGPKKGYFTSGKKEFVDQHLKGLGVRDQLDTVKKEIGLLAGGMAEMREQLAAKKKTLEQLEAKVKAAPPSGITPGQWQKTIKAQIDTVKKELEAMRLHQGEELKSSASTGAPSTYRK
jgi:hypothetical protein